VNISKVPFVWTFLTRTTTALNREEGYKER
jgi:hypothetical protein